MGDQTLGLGTPMPRSRPTPAVKLMFMLVATEPLLPPLLPPSKAIVTAAAPEKAGSVRTTEMSTAAYLGLGVGLGVGFRVGFGVGVGFGFGSGPGVGVGIGIGIGVESSAARSSHCCNTICTAYARAVYA